MLKAGGNAQKERSTLRSAVLMAILIGIVFVLVVIGLLQYFYVTLAFWTDVTFVNESGEEVLITPIGITENTRIAHVLHVRDSYFFTHVPNRRIHLDANESLDMTYDRDDQNLQFVIVEYPEEIRILKLDAEFWENKSYHGCCWSIREDSYAIPAEDELPVCPEVLRPTIHGELVEVTPEILELLMSI